MQSVGWEIHSDQLPPTIQICVFNNKRNIGPSAPLKHRDALPAESPNTHKGPLRIPHGILRPLVSGTQRLPQSSRAEPETAVTREADHPGLTWGTSPFRPNRAPGCLASGVS